MASNNNNKKNGKKVSNIKFTYDDSKRKITATWDFNKKKKLKAFDYFSVKWRYFNPKAAKWSSWSSEAKEKSAITGPITLGDDYAYAEISVKPVQKKQRGKAAQWTGGYVHKTTKTLGVKKPTPDTPNTPTVEITGTNLKAYIENYKTSDASIEFEIIKDDTTKLAVIDAGKPKFAKATITKGVAPGSVYRVRCRAKKDGVYSSWSDYSANLPTLPEAVPGIPTCTAMAVDEEENVLRVELKWQKAKCVGADEEKDSYEIEYTKNEKYFDRSADDVTSVESKNLSGRTAYITISDSGTYYFRVRGVNASGKGGWSKNAKVTVGLAPEAPTTWSYNTSIAAGDIAILNWTHNSADGSKQRAAQIEITVVTETNQQTTSQTTTVSITDGTMYYKYGEKDETARLPDGCKIQWRVKTKGVFSSYSEWSIQRTINVYQPPSVAISLDLQDLIDPIQEGESQEDYELRVQEQAIETDAIGKITSYPLSGSIIAGPDTQAILSLDFTITSMEAYVTEDDTGMSKYVAKGDPVFNRHIDNATSNTIEFELGPGDVALETDTEYKASVTVSMSSGLDASNEVIFRVDYGDDLLDPDCEVYFDRETYTAVIRPFCSDDYGADIQSGYTMRVYRRNYDGTFTRIVSDESNPTDFLPGESISVTDPHPALDYARYRIVAKSDTTGQIFFYDAPGEPANIGSIIINWSDEWSELENTEDEAIEDIPSAYYGSTLVLPYNVDVSESNTQDVALVEYIGREHPVSYYGTQKGYTASWKCEIPKSDIDSMSAIRRLARYAGDVYVREPSGAGYWAFIKVSYNIDHNKSSIPVTFDITRVEGGM